MTISSTDELTPPTEIHHDAPTSADALEAATPESSTAAMSTGPEDTAAERRRLEAELAAIEKKREELARALIVNAHPELAEPIRVLTGRLYAVARVEERMREPLSKAEVRARPVVRRGGRRPRAPGGRARAAMPDVKSTAEALASRASA
jgi:hypothetical protein